MTNTLPSKPKSARARDSAVGTYKHKRSATDIGLALITPCWARSSWTATTFAIPSTGV